MNLFSEHEEGCAPIRPCRHCQIVAFLKDKLDTNDFSTFAGLCGETRPPGDIIDLDCNIGDLDLSARVFNCLFNSEIKTLGDLVRHTDAELLRIPNLGRHSLKQVKEVLKRIGHSLDET